MRGDVVSPRKITEIRSIATTTRKLLGLEVGDTNTWRLLDRLSVEYGVTYDVVEDHEMPHHHAEACCIPDQAIIYLPEKSVSAIDRGDPRVRFTVHHEVGHFVLGHSKSYARANVVPAAYIDSEWQADRFAAEFLMPSEVIIGEKLGTAALIRQRFNVSMEAASYRLHSLQTEAVKTLKPILEDLICAEHKKQNP